MLERNGNESTLFVKPLGEGLGELESLGRGFGIGNGDGKVVGGDVLLSGADDVDLCLLV